MERIVFDNGFRLLLLHQADCPVCTLDVWVGVGSRYEQGYHGGISHLAEHMVFKSTHSRSSLEISLAMDDIGGAINAYTGQEHTRYYVKTLGEYSEQALELLADLLLHPAVPSRELELEREVVLEEIAMYEDSPEDLTHDLLVGQVWQKHPMGDLVSGTRESVSAIEREELLRFYGEHYVPNRMVMVCAGDFDRDSMLSAVERLFGSLPAGEALPSQPSPWFCQGFALHPKDNEQVCMELGFPGLSSLDEERHALSLFTCLLGDGESSRLFQRLREQLGLVYSVYAVNYAAIDGGVYTISVATTPDKQLMVLKEIGGVLTCLLQDGITDEELARAKKKVKTGLLMSLETVAARAAREGRSEQLRGCSVPVEEVLSAWERVTKEDVLAVARRVLKQPCALAAVGPLLSEDTYRQVLAEFPGGFSPDAGN